jgi:DNA-binding response OmpR family regulator
VRGQFPPARMSRTYLAIESRSFNRNRLAERDRFAYIRGCSVFLTESRFELSHGGMARAAARAHRTQELNRSLTLRRSRLDASMYRSVIQRLRFKAMNLEKCLQVYQKLLGAGAVIEIKSNRKVSSEGIALLRR